MKLAQVIGNVIATAKTACNQGLPLLVVRVLDDALRPTGATAVCTDTVGARHGEVVLICGSSSARMTERTRNACTDLSIVAIVETVSTGKTDFYRKGSDG